MSLISIAKLGARGLCFRRLVGLDVPDVVRIILGVHVISLENKFSWPYGLAKSFQKG